MARKRLPMRKTREILRQKWSAGLSVRQVAHAIGVSVGEVWKVARKAEEVGLDWATVEGFSEEEIDCYKRVLRSFFEKFETGKKNQNI
jgi:transposase